MDLGKEVGRIIGERVVWFIVNLEVSVCVKCVFLFEKWLLVLGGRVGGILLSFIFYGVYILRNFMFYGVYVIWSFIFYGFYVLRGF